MDWAHVAARDYGGPILIADLSRRKIPHKFLELILLELKRKGILHSKKGKGGGYYLSKPPELISVGEIIRVLDGTIALLPCVSQSAYRRCDECIDETTCGIRLVMKEVRDRTAEILDGTSLDDLVQRAIEWRKQPDPYHLVFGLISLVNTSSISIMNQTNSTNYTSRNSQSSFRHTGNRRSRFKVVDRRHERIRLRRGFGNPHTTGDNLIKSV
jgi:Rrf2 family protein